jgi:histidinol-phosphate phosphatase family protein
VTVVHAPRVHPRYAVVVPTLGRASLQALVNGLASGPGPLPEAVVLVDDRAEGASTLSIDVPTGLGGRVRVAAGGGAWGRGPAAARNAGWRALPATTPWVAFLDDDVVPPPGWRRDLVDDLAAAAPEVGGSQGRIRVPLPADRRPTDWERSTAGLADARWPTADMAYRRAALAQVGGFDERFPRAYREDADLALRVRQAGWSLELGSRHVEHPVRPADAWVSLRTQAGNADDVLMRRLHGRGWRERAEVPAGRRPRHLATTALAAVAALTSRGRAGRRVAAAAGLGWLALTGEFALARLRPGPWTRTEVARMLATSVLIPPAAAGHWLRGLVLHRDAPPWDAVRPCAGVLFDRDGTLVRDVPYNGDPQQVQPMPGAVAAMALLRRRGVPVGVVTNQSGVARGLLTEDDVARVHKRAEELLGPVGTWQMCPHDQSDGCTCRKPAPGMVHAAAQALGVPVEDCVLIGDIGSDVEAARGAGARAVLVPTSRTRPEEVAAAPVVAPDVLTAVRRAVRSPGGSR